jgi:bifunctional DNA-binding transcriptional regulator/antitoxin component of YhaV-PrlF toxin-antitoxin module
MDVLRRVIRVGGAYYISMPKPIMSELGVFRGAFVLVKREGTRVIVETDPEAVKKSWGVKP